MLGLKADARKGARTPVVFWISLGTGFRNLLRLRLLCLQNQKKTTHFGVSAKKAPPCPDRSVLSKWYHVIRRSATWSPKKGYMCQKYRRNCWFPSGKSWEKSPPFLGSSGAPGLLGVPGDSEVFAFHCQTSNRGGAFDLVPGPLVSPHCRKVLRALSAGRCELASLRGGGSHWLNGGSMPRHLLKCPI